MKVLLVRTDSQLGDTIFETCFYRELKRHFPQSYVTVMACGNRRVLENLPYIDEFIWLPAKGIGRILQAFGKLPHLWRQRYDVLVSLSPTWKMRFFNKLLPAKRKFPFEYRFGVPAVTAYTGILEQLGARGVDGSYTICIPPEAEKETDGFLAEKFLVNASYLLVNPIASCASYTLPEERVVQLVAQLRRAGVTVPLVLLDYKQLYTQVTGKNIFRFTSTDVLAVAAAVKKSAYVLTVDTAISHMAATFEKPMTVLFTDQPKPALPRVNNLEHLISFAPHTKDTHVLWAKKEVAAIPLEDIVRSVKVGWQEGK